MPSPYRSVRRSSRDSQHSLRADMFQQLRLSDGAAVDTSEQLALVVVACSRDTAPAQAHSEGATSQEAVQARGGGGRGRGMSGRGREGGREGGEGVLAQQRVDDDCRVATSVDAAAHTPAATGPAAPCMARGSQGTALEWERGQATADMATRRTGEHRPRVQP